MDKNNKNNKYSICVHHIVHAIDRSIVHASYESTRVVVRVHMYVNVPMHGNGHILRCRHRSCERSVNRL